MPTDELCGFSDVEIDICISRTGYIRYIDPTGWILIQFVLESTRFGDRVGRMTDAVIVNGLYGLYS